jgi:PRTRC genetic system ThiF family protein
MTSETPLRHYLPAALGNRAIKIVLVGCGGNGAQMLMGLASLDTALRAISSRSLDVTVVDDDIVSEANLGRQPFFRCDIGNSKARTLTERINLAHGLAWTAVHGRAPEAAKLDGTDIVITCVDTASARRSVGAASPRPGMRRPIGWISATALAMGNISSVARTLRPRPGTRSSRQSSNISPRSRTRACLTTTRRRARWPKPSSASRFS